MDYIDVQKRSLLFRIDTALHVQYSFTIK